MRLVKTIQLVAVAALAALVAPGPAAALEVQSAAPCNAAPNGSNECSGSFHETGTSISAADTTFEVNLTIGGSPAYVKCESSITGKLIEGVDAPLIGAEISDLSLSACKDNLGRSCSSSILHEPYSALVSYNAESAGDGKAILHETESGAPAATIACKDSNVLTPDIECTYTVDEENASTPEEDVANLTVDGGSSAQIVAKEVPLSEAGSLCTGENIKMNAEWVVSAPTTLYVVKAPAAITVDPDPIAIAKVGDNKDFTVENSGAKVTWKLTHFFFTPVKLTLNVNKCTKDLVMKPGDKCSSNVKCEGKGTWTVAPRATLPWGSKIDYSATVKCEV